MGAKAERHRTAVVGREVEFGKGYQVGAYSILQGKVKLGDGVVVGGNVTVRGPVDIGTRCYVGDNCYVGFPSRATLEAALEKGVDFEDLNSPVAVGEKTVLRSHCVVYEDVKIGGNVKFGHHVLVREKVSVGDNSVIGSATVIDGDCSIGHDVSIQSGVYIPTHTRIEDFVFLGPQCVLTNDKYVAQHPYKMRGPTIRKGVSIGANALVMPAVEIGEGAVVGAGAVVTKNVLPRTIVTGVPARKLRAVPASWRRSAVSPSPPM